MNGWTTLLATQEGLRVDTIDQYYALQAMNQCAVVLGIQPVQGVTLRTDVLGQTVFSALEKNVVSGGGRQRSEDEQRKFMQTVINIVDRTANAAATYGEVAIDTKLTKSQKAAKLLDSMGGAPAIVGYVATLGLTADKLLGKRENERLSARIYEAMSKDIDGETHKLKPLNDKLATIEETFDKLWADYQSMKKREKEAIRFLNEHLLLPRRPEQPEGRPSIDVLQKLINDKQLPDDFKQEFATFGKTAAEVRANPLLRALIIWTQIIQRTFANYIGPASQQNVALSPAALEEQIQARLQPAITQVQKQNSKQQFGQVKSQENLATCNQLSEMLQQISVATRLLLQEFLKLSQPV